MSRAAAQSLVRLAQQALARQGHFNLALSGGSTPRRLYQLLASEYGDGIAWDQVHLFWGDERCVPPDRMQSNFRLVQETLIGPLELPAENIHRISGEMQPPQQAAAAYERELREQWPQTAWPRFDLVLLGLGADGHTASLFPHDPVLEEREHWVRAVLAPAGYEIRRRITLTLPAINGARAIYFLVSGQGKAEAVSKALRGQGSDRWPASLVRPIDGTLGCFLDEAAAQRLQQTRGER